MDAIKITNAMKVMDPVMSGSKKKAYFLLNDCNLPILTELLHYIVNKLIVKFL